MGGADGSEAPKKAPAAATPNTAKTDALAVQAAANLRADLEAIPITRTEKVEAAKVLVVSPNYPPAEIIRRLAELLVSTPDFSSDL